jgi:hypothetical protein
MASISAGRAGSRSSASDGLVKSAMPVNAVLDTAQPVPLVQRLLLNSERRCACLLEMTPGTAQQWRPVS